jgi:hypothetical protein
MLQRSSRTAALDFNSASVNDANAGDSAGWERRHMRGVHTEARLAASLRLGVARSCQLVEAGSARSLASKAVAALSSMALAITSVFMGSLWVLIISLRTHRHTFWFGKMETKSPVLA